MQWVRPHWEDGGLNVGTERNAGIHRNGEDGDGRQGQKAEMEETVTKVNGL